MIGRRSRDVDFEREDELDRDRERFISDCGAIRCDRDLDLDLERDLDFDLDPDIERDRDDDSSPRSPFSDFSLATAIRTAPMPGFSWAQ